VFAVSERLDDDRLDALPADRLAVAIDSLIETLRVIEEVTLPGAGYGGWVAPTGDAPHDSWRDFLVAVPDRDDERLRGWRERLRTVPIAQGVFDRAQRLLEQLVHHCPDRRGVVHGDLLAGNVLVTAVSAIRDWGNALAGDPLYDLAWLTFWAPWHPGIDARRVRRALDSRHSGVGLNERLLCCQLHIALDGMQYQAFAGHDRDLAVTAARTERHLLAGGSEVGAPNGSR